MTAFVPPPDAFLKNLSFDDVSGDLVKVLQAFDEIHSFIDKFGFFVPQHYKDQIDELQKYVTLLEHFLNKQP